MITDDSQTSPCEQQSTPLTMFWLKFSAKNITANVRHVLYSTKAVFQRATYTTDALRRRIYGCGDDIFATRRRSRVNPLNFLSTDRYGTVKPTLRPYHIALFGRIRLPRLSCCGC